jgi:hypothetical protein
VIDIDIEAPLGDLRIALLEVDTLATMTKVTFDDADWTEPDPAVVEVISTLLGLIDKSSFQAMNTYHRLRRAVPDTQPEAEPPADKSTSPGEGMSAEDAAIIRRIRTRCPDRRFDGGTDEELLQLFKHNRQVLHRSDEDVIAAMTHPR